MKKEKHTFGFIPEKKSKKPEKSSEKPEKNSKGKGTAPEVKDPAPDETDGVEVAPAQTGEEE